MGDRPSVNEKAESTVAAEHQVDVLGDEAQAEPGTSPGNDSLAFDPPIAAIGELIGWHDAREPVENAPARDDRRAGVTLEQVVAEIALRGCRLLRRRVREMCSDRQPRGRLGQERANQSLGEVVLSLAEM